MCICVLRHVDFKDAESAALLGEWNRFRQLHCSNPYTHFNPLDSKGNYSATSNNTKLVHWPLMGGLLHLVQRGGDWVGPRHYM